MSKLEIKGFVPTSLVDWDGKVTSVIFLAGCNFKCGYCSNKDLVLGYEKLKTISFEKIKEYLVKNKEFVDGVVITGGEPTIHKDFPELCRKIKDMGFKVKIDTNGTNPEMLKELLDKKLVYYAAMDIKTSFDKYKEIINSDVDIKKIKESIEIIKKFPGYEFRVTLFPGISEEDLIKIAEYLKKENANKAFFIHQFRNEECLNPEYEKIKPYPKEKLEKFLDLIKNNFEKAKIRNV